MGTNGEVVAFNNGLSLSFALASDITHVTLADVPIGYARFWRGVFEERTHYLYLQMYNSLALWDVADPEHPVARGFLGDCAFHGTFNDFVVKGGYALVASGPSGLLVLDPQNGGRITVQNTFLPPSGMESVDSIALAGDYAIVQDFSNGRIGVYDVRNPKAPVEKGSARFATGSVVELFYDAPYLYAVLPIRWNPEGAFTGDTHVVICHFPDPGDLATFDSKPANAQSPVNLGDTALQSASLDSHVLYCATPTVVEMVDVTTPSSPALAGRFDDSGFHPHNQPVGVAVSGDLRVVGDLAGLTAFDRSGARTSYLLTGSWISGGFFYYKPFSLDREGRLGLISFEGEGVQAVDFSSVTPRRLGFWENTVGDSSGYVNDSLLMPSGQFAYVATEDATQGAPARGRIVILSLANPDTLEEVGSYLPSGAQVGWFPTDLTLFRERYLLAVMANADSGEFRLDVLDVSSPESPSLMGSYVPPAGTVIEGVAPAEVAGGAYAVLGCGSTPGGYGRIQTVDLADLRCPALKVDLDTGEAGEAAGVVTDTQSDPPRAYIAANRIVAAVELTDPSSADKTRISCIWTDPGEYAYSVAGLIRCPWGPLLAMGPNGGVDFYDLSDSACPRTLLGGSPPIIYGTSTASQAPGGDNPDIYLGIKTYGVGVAENRPDYTPPVMGGPMSPAADTAITRPVTLSVGSVFDDGGISEVQFWAIGNGCGYYLGSATTPSAPETYSLDFDPASVPESTVSISARAFDYGFNESSFFGGYHQLSAEPPLDVGASWSPDSGNAPLTVTFDAVVTGGMPPYYYSWDFGEEGFAKGPSTVRTFAKIGTYFWMLTVEDSRRNQKWASGQLTVTTGNPPPTIKRVKKLSRPFRLKVSGANFLPGCQVLIDSKPVPQSQFRDSKSVIVGEGDSLKAMCPKGTQVEIVVENPDGAASPAYRFRR